MTIAPGRPCSDRNNLAERHCPYFSTRLPALTLHAYPIL